MTGCLRKILQQTVSGLLLVLPAMAHAAVLQGALFSNVVDDRAFYAAGSAAHISVLLHNRMDTIFTGRIALAVCSRGQILDTETAPVTVTPDGAGSVRFSVNVPQLSAHAYLLVLVALSQGTGGQVRCSGAGVAAGQAVDVATGALNVAQNAWQDPIEAFVDAPTLAVRPAAMVAGNLAQYHTSLIQCYDCTWRHDEPYDPSPRWRNLEGVLISRAQLAAYAAALHHYGMKFLAYQLWNGAYADYPRVNPAINISMGLYSDKCGACTVVQQSFIDGGGVGVWKNYGWSADRIVEMNPGNAAWQKWMISQWRKLLRQDHFDGIHIDTLGKPSIPVYDFKGRILPDIGTDMPAFVNAASAATGCTDINQVSGWDLAMLEHASRACDIYIETHPEFGEAPYYASMTAMMSRLREAGTKPVIVAVYPQQVRSGALRKAFAIPGDPYTVCDPSAAANCPARDPGVELLFGDVALAGASPLLLGDFDHIVPGVYFPRASLREDPGLQQFLADGWNWFVAQRDLLRCGIRATSGYVSVTVQGKRVDSVSGVPGKIYARMWTKDGIAAGLDLINETGLENARIDDPDGTNAPVPQAELRITLGVSDAKLGELWFSAPDVEHGIPQNLAYKITETQHCREMISFDLPYLKTIGLIDLESAAFANAKDYRLRTPAPVVGCHS